MKRKLFTRVLPFLGLTLLCSLLLFSLLNFELGQIMGFGQIAERKARFSDADKVRMQGYLGMGDGAPGSLSSNAPAEQPESAPAEALQADGLLATTAFRTDRIVLKNGDLHLLVDDVDYVADEITQLALEYDGYVISSRIWSQAWEEQFYKHASLRIGVPADSFEVVVRRLRGFAVEVVDESTSGEDATDEFVDLESRLRSLEATRDRIRSFLDRAQNAEEALMVNTDLSAVETQIEEIKGRMNYLAQRGAYSTVHIQIDQQIMPAPLPAAMPSWKPGETALSAGRALNMILRVLGSLAIWLGIVIVPLAVPTLGLVWIVRRFLNRRAKGSQHPGS